MRHLPSRLLHEVTPCVWDAGLFLKTGKDVYLKMECNQPAGSFKIRGIGLLCQRSLIGGRKHLVSVSAGNAGFAAAYAGNRLGVRTTVVAPEGTSEAISHRLSEQRANVVVAGRTWDEAVLHARTLAASYDAAFIPPFEDPIIWEGHATIVDEMASQQPKPDVIVLSVGGGGLLCGVLEGLHRNHWGDVRVVAVETMGADSLHLSVRAGALIDLPTVTSIAKSLGAIRVTQRALDWTKRHPIESVVVSDRAAVNGCLRFMEAHRVLVEPACGAALAIAYENHPSLENAKTVTVVVCGGMNTSIAQLRGWNELIGGVRLSSCFL